MHIAFRHFVDLGIDNGQEINFKYVFEILDEDTGITHQLFFQTENIQVIKDYGKIFQRKKRLFELTNAMIDYFEEKPEILPGNIVNLLDDEHMQVTKWLLEENTLGYFMIVGRPDLAA